MVYNVKRNRQIHVEFESGNTPKDIAASYDLTVSRIHSILARERRKLTYRRERGLADDWEPDAEYLKEEKKLLKEQYEFRNPPPPASYLRQEYLKVRMWKLESEIRRIDKIRSFKKTSTRSSKLLTEFGKNGALKALLKRFRRNLVVDEIQVLDALRERRVTSIEKIKAELSGSVI